MQIIKIINHTVAFLLELGMLAAMGNWGYAQGKSNLSKYSLAILIIFGAIVLWGYFAAPKSTNRLNLGYRIIFEFVLFMIATSMLYLTNKTNFAIVFGVVAVLNLCLEYYFGE